MDIPEVKPEQDKVTPVSESTQATVGYENIEKIFPANEDVTEGDTQGKTAGGNRQLLNMILWFHITAKQHWIMS